MFFKNYPLERLLIDSIDSRLTKEEKAVRKWLIGQTIKYEKPINIDDIKLKEVFPGLDIKKTLDELALKNACAFDEEGFINCLYPVSALPTNHRVKLDGGRSFFSMCAVDSMGTAFTFREDVTVDSVCSECGTPINVKIKDGKILDLDPKELRVLHVDLNNSDNWSGSC